MPAEAIDYSYGVDDSTQTRKITFNLDKIKEFGVAMILGADQKFGESEECNTRSVPVHGYWQSNDLAHWVSQDYKNNSKLLEKLTGEIASESAECSNYILDFDLFSEYAQGSFNDDITNMLISISDGALLDSSESTISLAKRIAAMGDEDVDIERWAKKLAGDISKGND